MQIFDIHGFTLNDVEDWIGIRFIIVMSVLHLKLDPSIRSKHGPY